MKKTIIFKIFVLVLAAVLMCSAFSNASVLAEDTEVTGEDQSEAADAEKAEAQNEATGEEKTEAQDEAAGEEKTEARETVESNPEINTKKITIKPGKTTKLTVTGNVGAVEWISKNPDIATVSTKGKVKGISEGTVKIVAKVDGVKLVCKVKVEAVKKIKVIAVGDNLFHQSCIDAGKRSDGTRNYDEFYTHIKDYIADADVKIVNQETPFVDKESEYCATKTLVFGTPTEVGDALIKAGFNVVQTATNHTYDKADYGMKTSINYWKEHSDEVLMVGQANNEKDAKAIPVKEFGGIKIAFLNYTYGINGSASSIKKGYTINFLSESRVVSDIKAAKKVADVVMVLPHWGLEYYYKPRTSQVSLAKKMAEAGADVIIGAHPHVMEPMEIIKTSDGRKVPCYYSLGNFVSNMWDLGCQLEGMAEFTITMWDGQVTIKKAKLTPLVNYVSSTERTVYLLEDYTNELCNKAFSSLRGHTPEKMWKLYNGIVNGTAGEMRTKGE